MLKQARLSSKCQITIPKEVRDFLNVGIGDSVSFYFEDGQVKMTSTNNVQVNLKEKNKTSIIKGEK